MRLMLQGPICHQHASCQSSRRRAAPSSISHLPLARPSLVPLWFSSHQTWSRSCGRQASSIQPCVRGIQSQLAATATDAAAGAAEYQSNIYDEEEADEFDWLSAHSRDHIGAAFNATMGMLEWQRVCEHLASFTSTYAGRQACLSMVVPASQAESEELLQLTRSATVLEYDYATILDFGGINSNAAEGGLRRAAKAGMCSAVQLRAVASVVEGAEKLRKQVMQSARENDALGRNGPLIPVLKLTGRLKPQPAFVRSVKAAIDDENNVLDSASDTLRQCRVRINALRNRLSNTLKGYGGEVSEKSGRMCVALPSGTKLPPASMLLGSSAAGGIMYVEPPAAVALNNELAAARGEAYAAEEAVLVNLTSSLMGVLHDVQDTYKAVVQLDVLAAKVRYGLWIKGVLPAFVPWERVFHERGAAAARKRMAAGSSWGMSDQSDEDSGWSNTGSTASEDAAARLAASSRYAIRLKGLRHPLLLGDYLKERDRLDRELRRAGLDPIQVASSSASAAGMQRSGISTRPNGLSSRKEGLLREYGLDQAPSTGKAGRKKDAEAKAAQEKLVEQYNALRPPIPIDVSVKPHTAVVVITGPNTGGKTASMKALGLCALMARVGLPLPCDAPALLPAFSRVLADIGDEQSLTANLSTFSGHLTRIQALRAEADGKSLLLLDELGTGTDPVEGAALGVALLRTLVKGGMGGGALTIATTHHSIMTGLKFDDEQGRFENASVEFDAVALAPTYHLLWGIPGKSNALNIAARLGLDEDVIEAARSRLDTSVSTADAAISDLEAVRSELQGEETALWAVQQEQAGLKEVHDTLTAQVEALRKELVAAQEQAFYDLLQREKKKLAKLRESKRVKGVKMPTAAKKADDIKQEMAELAAQMLGGPLPGSQIQQQQEVQGETDTVSARKQGAGITLEDLADTRVDVIDLVDELIEKTQAGSLQAEVQQEQYDKALVAFESMATQLEVPAEPSPGATNAGQQQPASEAAVADEPQVQNDDEYDSLAASIESMTLALPGAGASRLKPVQRNAAAAQQSGQQQRQQQQGSGQQPTSKQQKQQQLRQGQSGSHTVSQVPASAGQQANSDVADMIDELALIAQLESGLTPAAAGTAGAPTRQVSTIINQQEQQQQSSVVSSSNGIGAQQGDIDVLDQLIASLEDAPLVKQPIVAASTKGLSPGKQQARQQPGSKHAQQQQQRQPRQQPNGKQQQQASSRPSSQAGKGGSEARNGQKGRRV